MPKPLAFSKTKQGILFAITGVIILVAITLGASLFSQYLYVQPTYTCTPSGIVCFNHYRNYSAWPIIQYYNSTNFAEIPFTQHTNSTLYNVEIACMIGNGNYLVFNSLGANNDSYPALKIGQSGNLLSSGQLANINAWPCYYASNGTTANLAFKQTYVAIWINYTVYNAPISSSNKQIELKILYGQGLT